MNNPNIFRTLVSMLPQDSINTLLKSTSVLNERVRNVEEDNYYWLLRLENEFNITIPINKYNEDWYEVYYSVKEHGLYYLLFTNNINLVKIGLMNGLDPSVYDNEAIISAVYTNSIDIAKLLLQDSRVDPSDQKNEALVIACTYGYQELVLLLLKDDRVNPADQNNKALLQAAKNNYPKIVKILLEDGRVDPSVSSNLIIKIASREGHIDVVRVLLKDSRVDPSADNNSALTLALKYNHKDVAMLLLTDDRVQELYNR